MASGEAIPPRAMDAQQVDFFEAVLIGAFVIVVIGVIAGLT